jgi:hypothetical protein
MIDTEKGLAYITAADLHAATLRIRGEEAELSDDAVLRMVAALTIARVSGAVTIRRA